MKPSSSLTYGSWAIRFAVIAMALVFIGERSAGLHTLPFAAGDMSHNVLIVFAFWADLLRPGFALCALWEASNVVARLGKGDAFGPAMVKGMRGIGLNLMFGAVGGLIFAPTLGYYAFGHGVAQSYGTQIESVTFGLIGLVFYVLARQGMALRSELEQYV